MAENHQPSPRGGNPRGLLGYRIIGWMKLGSGLLVFVAWLGMFRLFKSDVAGELERVIRHLRLDPEDRAFHWVLHRVSGLDRKHFRAIEAGTFFYALLHIVEGTGLIFERRWAGYLTIIATSSLIPYEVYEIARKANALKILALAVNIGFVIYLAAKLHQEHRDRDRAARPGAIAPESDPAAEAAETGTGREPS